jgi:hypothetical protein
MRFWNETRASDETTRHPAHGANDAAIREAYARGRRDERARHRRSPLMVTAFALAAVLGGAMLVSAAVRGSFEGGGQMIDTHIATAAQEAAPVLREAAHEASQAIGASQAIPGEATEVASGG